MEKRTYIKWAGPVRACDTCSRLMRKYRASKEDYPNTVSYGSSTECRPCMARRHQGLPAQHDLQQGKDEGDN